MLDWSCPVLYTCFSRCLLIINIPACLKVCALIRCSVFFYINVYSSTTIPAYTLQQIGSLLLSFPFLSCLDPRSLRCFLPQLWHLWGWVDAKCPLCLILSLGLPCPPPSLAFFNLVDIWQQTFSLFLNWMQYWGLSRNTWPDFILQYYNMFTVKSTYICFYDECLLLFCFVLIVHNQLLNHLSGLSSPFLL